MSDVDNTPYDLIGDSGAAGDIAKLRAHQAKQEIAEETERLQRRANGASGSLADAMAARSELKRKGISVMSTPEEEAQAQWNRHCDSVAEKGRTRYGRENFDAAIDSLVKTPGSNDPNAQAVMRQLLTQPDAEDKLMELGRHSLLYQASQGDEAADKAYSRVRRAEREQWRKDHGR
jgi:hypothetical protein